MRRMNAYGLVGLVVAFLSVASAQANVSLKNGNFFIGYTDVIYPGGFEPKIERIYNSKTPYNGMFGHGWGNEYEVSLTVSADGAVVAREYGGGAENRFSPGAFNAAELDKAVEMITGAARQSGILGSPDQIATYSSRLKRDATFRNDEWEKFRAQGRLKARVLPNNTKLVSNRFSYQYIVKTPDGYVRYFDNGRIEKFDDGGKLVRISDKNNNFIELAYGKDGKIQRISDNFNRKMYLSYNTLGKVDRIQGENGKESTYRYNELGELVYSKDVDGNTYTYKYSSDKHHNLVEIGYTDKTTMQMAYYGRDKFENIKSVKDRDGTVSEYFYENDNRDKGHSIVSARIKGADGKQISSSRYEYFLKYKPDGEEWTYKLVSELDGDKTETIYNECCGQPILIKRAGSETAFEYDPKGRVTKKTTPTELTKLQYHPTVGKVTRVEKYSKVGSKTSSWSTFQYDQKGNLIFAKNSEGKGVQLLYDNNGRISTLIDQNRRQIRFKYNESSKPVEITDPQLGTITVSYTNSGEIKKVDSTAGRKIALQVTSSFQNLLDIIRPAGVTLSF